MLNGKFRGVMVNGTMAFFQEFLKHPRQIASIVPSSQYLERRVVEAAGVISAQNIVELGAGTGKLTRAILRAMRKDAKLLSIEINPHLHGLVNRIKDSRLVAVCGDARNLNEIIGMNGFGPPEVIISGIPFSTMSQRSGSEILRGISSALLPGGRFVAYQVSNKVALLSQPLLGQAGVELELLNIPPMRVYRWEKHLDIS